MSHAAVRHGVAEGARPSLGTISAYDGAGGRPAWSKVAGYVVLAMVPCAGLNYYGARTGTVLPHALAQASPLLAALTTILIFPGRWGSLRLLGLHRLGEWRWYGWALSLAVIPIGIGYLVAAWSGLMTLPSGLDPGRTVLWLTGGYLAMTALPLIWAFTEEVGWRGFLQPRLGVAFGPVRGATLTGLIWAVWHYPFIAWAGYSESDSLLGRTALFTVALVPLSMVFAWLTSRSGSLWPAVLFHAALNGARTVWLTTVLPAGSAWVYVAGEAAAVAALLWAGLAWFVWRNQDRR